MTFDEFKKKWAGVPTEHRSDCPSRDGFGDFQICKCGLSELWKERSEDLTKVPYEEIRQSHETIIKSIRGK